MRCLVEIHWRSSLCVPRKSNHIFTARKRQGVRLFPADIVDARNPQPLSVPQGMSTKDLLAIATINDSFFSMTLNTDRANCRFVTSDHKEPPVNTDSHFPDALISGTDDRRRKSHWKTGEGSDPVWKSRQRLLLTITSHNVQGNVPDLSGV